MGVVNYWTLHCRLAKFRGFMYMIKYGAVIGEQYLWPENGHWAYDENCVSRPITAPYMSMSIKPRLNFPKRQCKLQWMTPQIKCAPFTTASCVYKP